MPTAASEKQQMNYQFNTKYGVIEYPFNYLSKKMCTVVLQIGFLEIWQSSQGKTCAGVLFL